MNPDPYRRIFGSDASNYAQDVQDHINFGTCGKVAGFIAETIQVRTIVIFLQAYCWNSSILILLSW